MRERDGGSGDGDDYLLQINPITLGAIVVKAGGEIRITQADVDRINPLAHLRTGFEKDPLTGKDVFVLRMVDPPPEPPPFLTIVRS